MLLARLLISTRTLRCNLHLYGYFYYFQNKKMNSKNIKFICKLSFFEVVVIISYGKRGIRGQFTCSPNKR